MLSCVLVLLQTIYPLFSSVTLREDQATRGLLHINPDMIARSYVSLIQPLALLETESFVSSLLGLLCTVVSVSSSTFAT